MTITLLCLLGGLLLLVWKAWNTKLRKKKNKNKEKEKDESIVEKEVEEEKSEEEHHIVVKEVEENSEEEQIKNVQDLTFQDGDNIRSSRGLKVNSKCNLCSLKKQGNANVSPYEGESLANF